MSEGTYMKVNEVNKDDQTPVHIAARAVNEKCASAAKLLIAARADLSLRDVEGKTALMTAVVTLVRKTRPFPFSLLN